MRSGCGAEIAWLAAKPAGSEKSAVAYRRREAAKNNQSAKSASISVAGMEVAAWSRRNMMQRRTEMAAHQPGAAKASEEMAENRHRESLFAEISVKVSWYNGVSEMKYRNRRRKEMVEKLVMASGGGEMRLRECRQRRRISNTSHRAHAHGTAPAIHL